MQDTTDRLDQSLRRARRGGPGGLDAQLRRSYARTEERLAAQARQARRSFPQLTDDWDEPVELPEPWRARSMMMRFRSARSSRRSSRPPTRWRSSNGSPRSSNSNSSTSEPRSCAMSAACSLCFSCRSPSSSPGWHRWSRPIPHDRRLIVLWTLIVCVAPASAAQGPVHARGSRAAGIRPQTVGSSASPTTSA